MNKLLAALCVAAVAISGWMHYDTQQQLLASQRQILQLNAQVAQLREQMALVHQEMSRANSNSIDGIVNDANEALLSGWESLVETVGKELKRAREEGSGSNQSRQDSEALLESPDGTERI